MTILDWTWIALAWAIGIGGVALFLWALLWDRPRGRRRCPKCWYNLSPTNKADPPTLPILCPECGRQTRRARKLKKTRRRWRWAVLGVVLVCAGIGALFGQRVYRDGLLKATPTWAYVVGLPWLDANGGFAELQRRVQNNELSQSEYEFLVQRAISVMRSSENVDLLTRTPLLLLKNRSRLLNTEAPGIGQALAHLVGHRDPGVGESGSRLGAVYLAAGRGELLPVMLRALIDEDQRVLDVKMFESPRLLAGVLWDISRGDLEQAEARMLVERVASCGLDYDAAVAIFVDGLSSDNLSVTQVSIWGIRMMAVNDPSVVDRMFAVGESTVPWEDPSDEVSGVVEQLILTMMRVGWRKEGLVLFRRHLTAESWSIGTLKYVDSFCENLGPLRDQVGHLLFERTVFRFGGTRGQVATAHVMLGGEMDETVRELLWSVEVEAEFFLQNPGVHTQDLFVPRSVLPLMALGAVLGTEPCAGGVPRGERVEAVVAGVSEETRRRGIATVGVFLRQEADPRERSIAAELFLVLGGDPELAVEAAAGAYAKGNQSGGIGAVAHAAQRGEIPLDRIRTLLEHDDPRWRVAGIEIVRLMRAEGGALLVDVSRLAEDPDPEVARDARHTVEQVGGWVRSKASQGGD